MKEEYKSMEELQEALDQHMILMNATPRAEMDNLSPNDMMFILYYTFNKDSPLQYKNSIPNRVIEQIPFYKLFKMFLDKIVEKRELKLTERGNLPRALCLELYHTGIIKEEHLEDGLYKFNKEADSIVLQNLKILGLLTKVIKKRNNKLSLTKTGEKLFHAEDQSLLFKTIFETNAFGFNLGYHDAYGENKVQSVLGYTFYLLLKYGEEERDLQFYVQKNLQAFEFLLEDFDSQWGTLENKYKSCYYVRIFERFLDYYGFLEFNPPRPNIIMNTRIALKTTALFSEVFEIRKENFKFLKSEHQA